MNNITFKNEKLIRRIFKQPFVWAILTVSNETGFHKIALKKNFFRNTYTVGYISNNSLQIEKKNVSLDDLKNRNIEISGLDKFYIENVCTSLSKPFNIIENEEMIYSKIDSNARIEEHEVRNNAVSEILNNHLQEKQQEQYNIHNAQINRLNKIHNLEGNLICCKVSSSSHRSGYYETNRYIYGEGNTWTYDSKNSNSNWTERYGLSFVIKQLEKYSKKIGFKGFENNRLTAILNKINVHSDFSYDDSVQHEFVFRGLLVEELYLRTIELCRYIRINRIDISHESYNDYYSRESTFFENSSYYSEKKRIDNLVNELINAVSVYIERLTGDDYSEKFKNELEVQQLVLAK